jgi:Transmembrane exosortase (Exosortase_EpsH).
MIPESLKKYEFFQLPALAIGFAACALMMISVVVIPLSNVWSVRQDYSFGYLVPLFCLFVLYDRWAKIFKHFKTPTLTPVKYSLWDNLVSFVFAGMFICGILVYFMGVFFFAITRNFGAPLFIIVFGFAFAFFAMAFWAGQYGLDGKQKPIRERLRFTGLFVFPAFIWLLSAPLFESVESRISLFLLHNVAIFVYHLMDSLGYVVDLQGNVLSFPNGQVGVADACSGIRSLTACLFAGSFLATVFLDKLWKKALMVALSMFLAFFNNLLRALFLSFWAYEYGPDSISGEVHDYAGYFVMGMTVIQLLLLMPLFQLSAVPKEFREAEAAQKE